MFSVTKANKWLCLHGLQSQEASYDEISYFEGAFIALNMLSCACIIWFYQTINKNSSIFVMKKIRTQRGLGDASQGIESI